jgi:hypothetical protein
MSGPVRAEDNAWQARCPDCEFVATGMYRDYTAGRLEEHYRRRHGKSLERTTSAGRLEPIQHNQRRGTSDE